MVTGIGLPTAIVAWLVGSTLLLYSLNPAGGTPVTKATGVFFVLAAAAFATGGVSGLGPNWFNRTFSSGLWALGALGTLLHLYFPKPNPIARLRWVTLVVLGIGIGGALWAFSGPASGANPSLNREAHSMGQIWFVANLVVWLLLLAHSWSSSPTLGERRQIGVVAVGGILAIGPFLGVLMLPRVLGWPAIPGADLTLLSVALLPIAYGYALLRYRKIAQDRVMARLIVYAYTAVVVVIVFFAVMAFPGFRDISPDQMIWLAAGIGGVVAGPLMRAIERWLSWLLFGRWSQPLQVAGEAMRTIDLRVERQDLASQVRAIIGSQLQIYDSTVLLLDKDRRLYDPEESGLARSAEGVRVGATSALARALDDNVWVREFDDLQAMVRHTEQEALLAVPWARAVLPLRFDNKLTGVILVGYRSGVTFYDLDELIVLQLVAIAAAAAFHRRKLFVDLENERDQASLLSQQILAVRGEERKRVARDLHDDIIQPLIAHSYGLAVLDAPTAPRMRDNTLELVDKIRVICAELREPTLDTLGLGAAVRAAASAFQSRTQRNVELIVDQDPSAQVPDTVASAALGVLQEALANADKHAQAQTIQVRVAIRSDLVNLNVRDDGRGFDVAEARRRATQTNHFGLLGADERVAAVGGAIRVHSLPGQGTTIDVHLPIRQVMEAIAA
ncbi:MAG TPA: ATP-binding protein [Anaerolineales bacterium]|nr:ATP-binding protein [Anaerolineales bacterium]